MNNKQLILIFAILGTLFAGYLSISKLILGYCPLKEPCPIFLGQPACVTGLVLYLAILIISMILLLCKNKRHCTNMLKAINIISIVGILFAIYNTYLEIFTIKCPGGCTYSLLIPTCIYGLIMFILVYWFSRK
jgi:hypothetical protein